MSLEELLAQFIEENRIGFAELRKQREETEIQRRETEKQFKSGGCFGCLP